jgi:hypothetical protein
MVKLVVILLLLATATARADKLADARKAVDEARFDEARKLLVEAIDAGGNPPVAVRQIYELSASTAIVLGERDLGEQYYRRWLALDPNAKLPAGSSPKLVEVFVAAQAYMAAHGRLVVRASRLGEHEVEVVVDSDPLAMATAAISPTGIRASFGADRKARVDGLRDAMTIAILDEHGNGLLDLAVPALTVISIPDSRVTRVPMEPKRSVITRWQTWAIPSAAFLIAGGILGAIAVTEHDELDNAIANSGLNFFPDVEAKQRKVRQHATLAIGLGATAALLAIPAVVFYVRAQRPWKLGPVIGPNNTIGITGRF